MKISAPWIKFKNELMELFAEDEDVTIKYHEKENLVNVFVEGQDKEDALQRLLPAEKNFGGVVLRINVLPANRPRLADSSLFDKAFRGNPAVSFIKDVSTPFGDLKYVVFKKKVVQFYDDDMSDLHGNCSTLYQEIAKDIFESNTGVCFSTDIMEEEK